MRTLLLIFSYGFIVTMLLMVAVPYLRRRAELLTAWNLFLLGSACFVGFSGVSAASNPLPYLNYDPSDYVWFFAGVVTFYTSIFVVYRYWRFPRKIAGRTFRKWPPTTPGVLFLMLPACLLLAVGELFPPHVIGLAQIVAIVGAFGMVFGLAFSVIVWYQHAYNPILLALVGLVFLVAVAFSFWGGTGRRHLLSVLLVAPVCLYWLRYRARPPGRVLMAVGVVGLLGFLLINGYTSIRHSFRGEREKDAAYIVQMMQDTVVHMFDQRDLAGFLGQNAVECSLVSIHLYGSEYPQVPFDALTYIAVNPIPRSLWPDKPKNLGTNLPTQYGVDRSRSQVTWGPGIIGHGFHDGGLLVLVVYAILFGSFLAFFDSLLLQQPDNPFLLGTLAAIGSQIMGWPRGDIGTFSIQIIGGVLAALGLALLGRMVFGTGVVYPVADQPMAGGHLYREPSYT